MAGEGATVFSERLKRQDTSINILKPINIKGTKVCAIQRVSHNCMLLLGGGIIQTVPSNCNNFLIYLAPHLVLITPHSSTLVAAETPSSKVGRKQERHGHWILPISISIIPQGIFNMLWKLMTWGQWFYLSSEGSHPKDLLLKFIALPGLNPQILGPVVSTITTTPP
jgi:hypothetical protein